MIIALARPDSYRPHIPPVPLILVQRPQLCPVDRTLALLESCSQLTRWSRKTDSNPRSLVKKNPLVRDGFVRLFQYFPFERHRGGGMAAAKPSTGPGQD
jgi:hypothetical protein